jgi:signal transduction histidine kinase/CheY-like chemotaxis protein/CHASE3 domain sensor protein
MPRPAAIDDLSFRRILSRNITLPLAAGVVTAGVFVAIFAYLLNSLSWVEHSERVIAQTNELRMLTVDMESGMRGYLLTGEEVFLAPYKLARPKIETSLGTMQELVSDNPDQVQRLRHIRLQQLQWDRAAQEMIAARQTGDDYVGMVKAGRAKVDFDELRKQFDEFMSLEQRLRNQRTSEARSVTYFTVAIFLAISLITSGLLAWFGRRDLLRLSTIYSTALHEQNEHADRLTHQAWLRSGQSQLAEQGIGQQGLSMLSATLLRFLARYLDVAVGALYVREQDGTLRRMAAYGFSQEDEQHGGTLAPEEGIVGQAATSKRMLHLKDIPPGYIKVSSGLGEGMPRELIVLPVDSDGQVNGVVELGFLHPVGERELDYLKLVAANVGSAIEATLARQRIAEVLTETQQLNEELQVQQEELRTANEELEEQSHVLEQSQVNLENQKAELEQTNERLAEQALMLDQRNVLLGEAREQLEMRAHDLERASQYKSQFLANMSHELRTPLNSALILSKLLADNEPGNLNEEQVRFARTIYSSGNDLLNLINDILDISKVEAGKLELTPEELPLQRVMDNLWQLFETSARQKGLDFVVDVEPGVPASLYTDAQRLEQILKNLLSNAIKFTDEGKVLLRVSAAANGQLSFIVQDTGIGIRADQQDPIFDAFQQADGSTSRRFGGTGLGLAISRDLATLLGGAISVSSIPGQGSTFTLTLPVQWAAPPAPAAAPGAAIGRSADSTADLSARSVGSSAFTGPSAAARQQPGGIPASGDKALPSLAATLANSASATSAPGTPQALAPRPFEDDRGRPPPPDRFVLVIEDEPNFARILFDLAHEQKYRCLVAFSAEEGLQLAEAQQPSAILLDIRLPDRSGLSVLQLLKDNPKTRHIPVHVVSAAEHGEAALHLGAIGYARKPASREELQVVFNRLEQKFTQKIKHILLVEDDDRQRDSVVQLIADDDIDIKAVATGEEALQLLHSNIFDCMIIDLKLPDMQGKELLERMSQEEIASFPPVIVYTGRSLTRAEEADLQKYSRSIIIKGARSPERLLDEVTLFLHKVESEMSSERQNMLKAVRSRDKVFEGRRILLVDDDVRNIFALTSALEQKGAIVEIGRNGYEALNKLDAVPDIDLVLMDIMMPGMDGLEATRRIRADQRFARLPVIAITAKAMKDDQEQCLAAGASDYLAKPIDLSRLYSLLRVWMPVMDRV